jgi:SNF family Na+-dependent transporter
LSLTLGVIGTYAAYLQEARFQYSEADNPWLMGIAINSVLAAVFILPISAVIGRLVQRAIDNRLTQPISQTADKAKDID